MHPRAPRAAALSALGAALAGAALLASCRFPLGAGGKPHPAAAARTNRVCYECHIDFQGEELGAVHEKAGVSCVRCHGPSKPHMDDEVRKTPPDAVFRGAAMRVFCLACHDPVEHLEVAAHAAEAARPPDAKRRACTACHGEHQLIDTTTPATPG